MNKTIRSFYESGYINPNPKKSPLLKAIDMLVEERYENIVVCVNSPGVIGSELWYSVLTRELKNRGESFFQDKVKSKVYYKGATIEFFFYRNDDDLVGIRGRVYEAGIVKGKPSELLNSLLSLSLRGNYPIRIYI